jgi:hypothetical protein
MVRTVVSRWWITSREFWLATAERATKTFAQGFLGIAAGQAVFNAFTAPWQAILGVAVGMSILSVLTSVVSAEIGERGTPSLVEGEL